MNSSRQYGPLLATLGVFAAVLTGIFADPHIAAWVLFGLLIVTALIRALAPDASAHGLAVRSRSFDVTLLLIGAIALIFLAQTAPALF